MFLLYGFECQSYSNEEGKLRKTADRPTTFPDDIEFADKSYLETVKSVELYRMGWRLSAPYRNLSDTTRLVLEFDDLTSRAETYTYTVIHCTPDWQPTDLSETEYISGLPDNEIRNYRYSRNTTQPYIHYQLSFPNEDLKIKLSGNYILYVYRNFNREDPVLTRRFYIVEPLITVRTAIHRTDNLNYFGTHQEVDFSLDYSSIRTDNPQRDIRVSVVKNYCWESANTELLPKFVHPDSLVYDFEEENLFPGGSEFRHFDTKSLRFNSDRIAEIRFERPLMRVFLKPDLENDRKYYVFQEDINGKYLIKWDDASDSDIEGQYVWVNFRLQAPEPFDGSDVYVFGGLSDWRHLPECKMIYNQESQSYQVSLLLKQGYYNYQYSLVDSDGDSLHPNPVEWDFYETVNDYYIFVYYQDIRDRFARLAGLDLVSSANLKSR